METKSIRKSQADMNVENTMAMQRLKPGTLICYRCGKKDHLLGNCPLPYQPTLAFAPKKDHAVKTTLLVEEEGTERTDSQVDNPQNAHEDTSEPVSDLLTIQNLMPEEEESREDWDEDLRLASWISPTTESIFGM